MLNKFIKNFQSISKNTDLKNIFISFLIKSFGILLSFSFNIILIDNIGIKSYGEYTIYISLISFFSMLAIFGRDKMSLKILTQYFSLKNHKKFKLILANNLKAVFTFSLLIVFSIYSFKIYFDNILNVKTMLLACSLVLIPLKSISSIYFSAIRAIEKLYVYLCLELIIRRTLLIFFILVIKKLNWINTSTFYVLSLTIIIYFFIIIFSNYYIERSLDYKDINLKSNKVYLNQRNISLYIFFIQSISLFNLNIDNIFIEYFIDTEHVTYYKVCSQIVMISGFTLNSINVFLAPTIAKLFCKKNVEKLQRKLTLVSKLNLASGIICFLLIVFFGKYLLFLHDETMVDFYSVVLILLVGITFHVFCGSVTHLMIMTNMEKIATILIFISAIINLSYNLLLIPKYGLIGCAISTTLSTIFYNMFSAFFILKKIRLNSTIFSIFTK